MKIVVSNRSVRKNISFVQKLVDGHHKKTVKKTKLYKAFVNAGSGELHLIDRNLKKENIDTKIWKKVVLKLKVEPAHPEDSKCELLQIPSKGITTEAKKVIQETMQVFNLVLRDAKKELAESKEERPTPILQVQITKNCAHLVQDAWHPIDRFQAENTLLQHPPGGFLFRKDEFAMRLEESIGHHCFTLSYLNANEQVVDRTIVLKGNRYLFYNDDPNLEGKSYSTIAGLLKTLKDQLILPLSNTPS